MALTDARNLALMKAALSLSFPKCHVAVHPGVTMTEETVAPDTQSPKEGAEPEPSVPAQITDGLRDALGWTRSAAQQAVVDAKRDLEPPLVLLARRAETHTHFAREHRALLKALRDQCAAAEEDAGLAQIVAPLQREVEMLSRQLASVPDRYARLAEDVKRAGNADELARAGPPGGVGESPRGGAESRPRKQGLPALAGAARGGRAAPGGVHGDRLHPTGAEPP